VTIPATSITAGTSYWIAVLAPTGSTGTIQFRDVTQGTGRKSETSLQTTLTSLPATWSVGPSYTNSPMSAYVSSAGSATATYVYDGDGKRFSTTVGAPRRAMCTMWVADYLCSWTTRRASTSGALVGWLTRLTHRQCPGGVPDRWTGLRACADRRNRHADPDLPHRCLRPIDGQPGIQHPALLLRRRV
jgi:hypothetical protein